MIKKLTTLMFFILFSHTFAQDNLKFEFDYSRYQYDSTTVFFELYYSFNQTDLKQMETDQGKMIEGTLEIVLSDINTKKVIFERTWNVPSLVSDEKQLVGVLGLFIPKGIYNLKISAVDKNNPSKNKVFNEKLDINPFGTEKLSISDIELARNIKREGVDKNSLFYKNTMEVIPNPESVFSDTQPNLYYYAEIYDVASNCTDKLKYFQIVLNGADREVHRKEASLVRNAGARIDVGRINLSKFPTDTYKLLVIVSDSCGGNSYTAQKQFYFYNPGVFDTTMKDNNRDLEYLSGKFVTASEEECDDYFEKALYIASQDEIDEYDKLTVLDSKREFLHEFWKKRQGREYNNLIIDFDEYYRRIDYADKNYSAMGVRGYKSDRGHVYVKFGAPDEIDRHPSGGDTKPYIEWFYYSIESGVQFVFGDLSGFGNYELLHSNKRGEKYDPNYMGMLQVIN